MQPMVGKLAMRSKPLKSLHLIRVCLQCSLEFRLFQQPIGGEAFALRRQGRIRSRWRIKGKLLVIFSIK